jgi:putative zinc finger protein
MNPQLGDVNDTIDSVRRILIESDNEPSGHVVPELLTAYVDKMLDAADTEVVEAHVDDCSLCRADVQELRDLRAVLHRSHFWRWAAAAIVVPAGVASWLWISSTRHEPHQRDLRTAIVRPYTYDNPDWQNLVSSALEQHALPASATLATVRGVDGPLRGPASESRALLQPAGVVIDSIYPHFSWPSTPKGRYTLTIADGDIVIATHAQLTEPEWQCDTALARGRTYTWQVEVRTPSGERNILPSTLQPPAMFHILSAAAHADIATAAARYPQDHMLLAALYARAGMDREAREEIRRLAATTPADVDVRRLVSNTLTQP